MMVINGIRVEAGLVQILMMEILEHKLHIVSVKTNFFCIRSICIR